MSRSKRRLLRKTPSSTLRSNEAFKFAFGLALDAQLSANQMTKTDLANAIGVSNSMVTLMMNGDRYVSPERVDTIATSLGATGAAYSQLHQAAAISAGFKLDLTKPEKKD